jgi:hypothetical protein
MRQVFALVISCGYASICFALPVTFIHEGSGSGTLGGNAFNTNFVITAQADTNARVTADPGIYFIDHNAAQIALSGIGTFAFTSPTRTFVNNPNMIVGFSRANTDGADLFDGPVNPSFATWNMLTSIGPISGSGELIQWTLAGSSQVTTTNGVLIFNNAQVAMARVTARVVPEPAAIFLGLGAALLWALGPRATPRRTGI